MSVDDAWKTDDKLVVDRWRTVEDAWRAVEDSGRQWKTVEDMCRSQWKTRGRHVEDSGRHVEDSRSLIFRKVKFYIFFKVDP
jgi:hypothetical protein